MREARVSDSFQSEALRRWAEASRPAVFHREQGSASFLISDVRALFCAWSTCLKYLEAPKAGDAVLAKQRHYEIGTSELSMECPRAQLLEHDPKSKRRWAHIEE